MAWRRLGHVEERGQVQEGAGAGALEGQERRRGQHEPEQGRAAQLRGDREATW